MTCSAVPTPDLQSLKPSLSLEVSSLPNNIRLFACSFRHDLWRLRGLKMLPVIEKATYNLVPPSDESSDGSYSEETALMQEGLVKRRSPSCSLILKVLCGFSVLILYSAALIQMSMHISEAGRMRGTRAMDCQFTPHTVKSVANRSCSYHRWIPPV